MADPQSNIDIFVAYSQADEEWTHSWLLRRLQQANLRVATQEAFIPGQPKVMNWERSLKESRHLLLVISPAWLDDNWQSFAAQLGHELDPDASQRRVIPLLLKECEKLPGQLRRLEPVDFLDEARREKELARLLRAVQPDASAQMPSSPQTGQPAEQTVVTPPISEPIAPRQHKLPPCPFVAGARITDPRLFVGRREELRVLRDRMTGAQPTSLNLYGERRMGKSSLLYHFFQTWPQRVSDPSRYVVVYLSLQEARTRTEEQFYRAVAESLAERPGIQANSPAQDALRQSRWSREIFSAAMEAVHWAGMLPVLCLDEFDNLFEKDAPFDDGFFDNLRSRMDDSHLMLILATHQELDVYRKRKRLTSSFFNLGHTIHLERLSAEEAGELARLPASTVPDAQAALGLDEQQTALAWGDRHPYRLQLAASALCEARRAGKDKAWARRQYDAQARRLPQPSFARRLLRPLWWLVWELPRSFGSLAQRIGVRVDEMLSWLIGIGILLALALGVAGLLNQTQILALLAGLLGISP